jgi:hypothetical protein
MYDTLHGADADAQLAGDLLDALALTARRSDSSLDYLGRTGSAEGLALSPRTLESGPNPLANHCPLELGEHATHLEHGLAGHGRGVDALSVQVQIDALGLQIGQQDNELLQRSSQSIDGPGHHQIDLPPDDRVVEPIVSRSLIPTLRTADAMVNVLGVDVPIHALGDSPQLLELVVGVCSPVETRA